MSLQDVLVLLPMLVIGFVSILVLLAAAFVRRHGLAAGLTLGGFVVALAALGLSWTWAPRDVGGLLTFDRFVIFGMGLVLAASVFVTASSWAYLRGHEEARGEYYFLLLLASLGAMVLAAASAFATFFLGLELLSVSLYTLIAWKRERGAGARPASSTLSWPGPPPPSFSSGWPSSTRLPGAWRLEKSPSGRPGAQAALMESSPWSEWG